MAFSVEHYGLYFGVEDVQQAQTHAQKAPFAAAFAQLSALQPSDALGAANVAAARYRLLGDESAAQTGLDLLMVQGVGLLDVPASADVLARAVGLVSVAHSFEMLRDFAALNPQTRTEWMQHFAAQVSALSVQDVSLLERVWVSAAQVAGGVVLADEALFLEGVGAFRRIVDTEIHPEGYLPALVTNSNGGALVRQVLAAKGLVLAAEASTRCGVDLWNYEQRGISVKTCAIYAAAYYEYRHQWKWDTPPDEAENEQFYHENAAFLELLNRQLRPAILKDTMQKLRPLYDAYGGGATTLTHAQVQAKRGFFGLGGG